MWKAILGGLIGGIISPFIVSFLQHKYIWKNQKKIEIKYSIFIDAVKALSQYAVDATDPKLQSEKKDYKGMRRVVEARPETFALMEKSKGMVKAFFSEDVYNSFYKALSAKVSIENIPNADFEAVRASAIIKLAEELDIIHKKYNPWSRISGKNGAGLAKAPRKKI